MRWNGQELKDPRPLKGRFNDIEINDEQDLVRAVPKNRLLYVKVWDPDYLEGYLDDTPFRFEVHSGCQALATAAFMNSPWYFSVIKHGKKLVKILKKRPASKPSCADVIWQTCSIFDKPNLHALADQIQGNPQWYCRTPKQEYECGQYVPVLIQKLGYQFYFGHSIDYLQRTVTMSVHMDVLV